MQVPQALAGSNPLHDLRYGCLINGEWLSPRGGQYIALRNPATQELLAEVARGTATDVEDAVTAAASAAEEWGNRPPVERARILHAIASRLVREKERLAMVESLDTGKPLSQARADAVAAARFFEYYAGVADKVLGSSIPLGIDYADFTVREPIGITAHIVPWNYPMQIMCRGLAPALATGNTAIIKPAELACLSVLEIAKICHEEGLPPGVLNVVPGYGHEAGAALVSHPKVNLVVFTGSVATGTRVMKAAAENIVPVLLELGGKSPNVLLSDSDLDTALPQIVRAAFPNSGQACSAGTRLLVQRAMHDEVAERLGGLIRSLKLGAGIDDPDLGPLVSEEQKAKVNKYIEIGQDEGADMLCGGSMLDGADMSLGNFVLPTVLTSVRGDMRVHNEEIFGPVLTVIPFDTVEEALMLANSTEYGLVAGVWGQNVNHMHWLASRIKAGQIFMNCYGAGGGVELPFGGYRKSGIGREKGLDGLLAYTQVKNICLRIAAPTSL